jgi:hypothetical protein
MSITEQELNEILEYQIETIIRRDTTYEFEIINSPLVLIDGKSFVARTDVLHRITEHQLTSRFNSIREEFMNQGDSQYEMIDYRLTAMEFILSFLEKHKGKKIFIMGESFYSGLPHSPYGTNTKSVRTVVI